MSSLPVQLLGREQKKKGTISLNSSLSALELTELPELENGFSGFFLSSAMLHKYFIHQYIGKKLGQYSRCFMV